MSQSWVLAFNAFAQRAVEAGWHASWQGAILIAAIWALGKAWKRMPANLRCALWVIACLRILVLLSAVSIPIACLPSPKPLVVSKATLNVPEPKAGLPTMPALPEQFQLTPQESPRLSPIAWLLAAWAIGAIACFAFTVRQSLRTLRLISIAEDAPDRALLAEAEEICRRLGMKRVPKIRITDRTRQILTYGAIRPTILLSAKSLADCSSDEWRMVLTHELAHVRRRDAWLGLVPQFTQIIPFFHPLVWFACREFELAREAACDELAVSCLGVRFDQYSRLLLKLGSRHGAAATLLTPGVTSHFHLLRRRIDMLEKSTDGTRRKLGRRPIALFCLAGALCLAPLTLVSGQQGTQITIVSRGHTTHSRAATLPLKASKKRSTQPANARRNLAKTSVENAAQKFQLALGSSRVTKAQETQPYTVKVYHIANGSSRRIAEILNQMLSLGERKAGKASADDYSNSVILAVQPGMVGQLEKVIQSLDTFSKPEKAAPDPETPTVVRTIPVRETDCESMLKMVSTLYRKLGSVRIVTLKKTNSLVISGSEDNIAEINNLVNLLDVPSNLPIPVKSLRVFHLKYAKSEAIVELLKTSIKGEGVEFIGSDPRTNSMFIKATSDGLDEVSRLLTQLDKPEK